MSLGSLDLQGDRMVQLVSNDFVPTPQHDVVPIRRRGTREDLAGQEVFLAAVAPGGRVLFLRMPVLQEGCLSLRRGQ